MTETARRLMIAYVASAITAAAFGVAHNRFFVMEGGTSIRFLGSHEPNFTAMFLDVALVIWLTLSRPKARSLRSWLLDTAVLGVLLGGIAMTGSLTGLAITGCMLLITVWRACARRGVEPRARRIARLSLRLVFGVMAAVLFTVGSQRLALLRPQHERDIYAVRESTGVAGDDAPAYIAAEEYRMLRAAGEPVEPRLLTSAQWKQYRDTHGIEPFYPRLEEAEHLLQDAFSQAIRRVPVLGNRLYTVLGYAKRYGLDTATSGRWGLIVEKLRDFSREPLWQMLIGRGPDPETSYSPMLQAYGYSHNSFLDMLTGFGACGLAALLWWFVRTARGGRLFGLTVDKECGLAITMARVALLLHAATLSMHLNRVFLFFMIG